MKLILLALLIALLPQDPPAEAWHTWHGYGVGSRTVVRKTDIGGAEDPLKIYRRTVTALEKGTPTVETDMKTGEAGEWEKLGAQSAPYDGKTAAAHGHTEKELPKGEFTIDGKKVAVTVSEWTSPKGEVTLTVSRAAGLKLPLRCFQGPGGYVLLPVDTVGWKLTSGAFTYDVRVVATGQKRKVGEKEVECMLEEGTSTTKIGEGVITGKTRVWSSLDVPGRLVRSETENTVEGKVTGSVEELVEFEAKPVK